MSLKRIYLYAGVLIFFPSFEETATAKDKTDMVTELNVMKRLKPHPHVLKLIGCCSHRGKSNILDNDSFAGAYPAIFQGGGEEMGGGEFRLVRILSFKTVQLHRQLTCVHVTFRKETFLKVSNM